MAFQNPTQKKKPSKYHNGISIRLSEQESKKPNPIVYCYLGEGLLKRFGTKVGSRLSFELDPDGKCGRINSSKTGIKLAAGGSTLKNYQGTYRDAFIQIPFRNPDLLHWLFPNGMGCIDLSVKIVEYRGINGKEIRFQF